ncbi:G-type lectin S-receptor-like serine/threonine-protein kinase [Prunus yedoensis var. nudiflora]|uniref:Receptor-like serine/threonine-protein kinase n=1 Tax=Prunus yedoensis var. nudiflora TaxID=2094558 RepID=A0A315AGJ7_PRUYE|nr:G-type lectin S-receptor-like serine/threonine-protein kinase [Prunus yedoensis var. nudiflora]
MACMACLLLALAFVAAEAQQMQANISRGSSLTPTTNSTWLSRSGLYAFGFYRQGNGYAVGIFLAGIPKKTVIWTANRDDPPVSNNATLLFTGDGLALSTEEDQNYLVKSSGSSSYATILDSGNFVLYNSSQEIVWQSFDHPTDTLLPGQRLLAGEELFSAKSEADHSTGIFRLKMQNDGNLVQYPVDSLDTRPYAYYASSTFGAGENVTLNFGAYGHLYLLNSTGSNIRNITDGGLPTDEGKLYLMRIDADGIFRLYSHGLKKNAILSIEWVSSKDKCVPKGLCGLNSYCVLSDLKAECRCLPGFEFVNQGNPTSGCERNFVADACKNRNENFTYTMEELESTTWEDVSYNSLRLSNKDDCIQGCLEDCDCAAAFFDDTNCRKQRLPLKYGRRANGTSNIALIKVGAPKPDTDRRIVQPGSKKKAHKWIWIGTAIGAALLVMVLCISRRKLFSGETNPMVENELLEWMESDRSTGDVNGLQNDGKMGNNLTVFSYASVVAATTNFSKENKLGQGGFGPVYKGKLVTGQEIAVKRLSRCSGQGTLEFKNELILISELQHTNLVQLFGFCIHGEERILIYAYMPNKSLDYFLFDSTRAMLLDWTKRFNIIEGIAQGLLYLHKYSRMRVIHRDLKASNVLLDEYMKPKISDFGLARIFTHNELEANTNRVVGTYGYMSPEYAMEGIFSIKSDVYSFGVLMLEIISGRKNSSFYNADRVLNIVGYAWELWKEGRGLELMDPTLKDSCTEDQLFRCFHVGLLCVEENAADRPSMSDVVSMLTTETISLPLPTRPAFVIRRNVIESDISRGELQVISVNGLSNTTVAGR